MSTCPNTPVSSLSMIPYNGQWTIEQASHLLRRTLFGPTRAQINQILSLTVDQAVESILQIVPPTDPITWYPGEAISSQGQSWVNDFLPLDETLKNETNLARKYSMYTWLVKRMNDEQNISPSITE